MNIDKKFAITIGIIILIISMLLAYYFSLPSSGLSKNNTSSTSSNNTTSNGDSNKNETGEDGENTTTIISLGVVKDYENFFTINNLINEYYINLIEGDGQVVLNMLDTNYIKKHKITSSNIKNYMENTYHNITYFSKNMYFKGINKMYYYFVNGERQNYSFADEILTEEENVNFLIIVDMNNYTYSITPLDITESVFNYAQTYKMNKDEISFNKDNVYTTNTVKDEIIATYYIDYFKNMLYLNTEKAYEMLSNDTKAYYETYENFVNNLETIYSNISTNIFSYSVTGENGKRTYDIIDKNQRKLKLDERSIMDFIVTIPN